MEARPHHRPQLQGRVDAASNRQDCCDQRAPRSPAAAGRWRGKEEVGWTVKMGSVMEVLPNSLFKGRGSSMSTSGDGDLSSGPAVHV